MKTRIGAAAAVLAFSVATVGAIPAMGDNGDHGGYLALGDSIPFGFNPLVPLAQRGDPTRFVGYPEAYAASQGLVLANLSCPGETSGSMIATPTATTPDFGCQRFRARNKHLHTDYAGTQLGAAVTELETHPDTSLVSISIGHNDLQLLESACQNAVSCEFAGLPAMQARLASNLTTIFGAIRRTGYDGELVAVTYYAANNEDATEVALIRAVDQTLAAVTRRFGGDVANGFQAFRRVARQSDGNACLAGLLIVLTAGPVACDFHPSAVGRDLLARTLARAATSGDGNAL